MSDTRTTRDTARNKVVIYEEEGGDPSVDLLVVGNTHGRTRVRAVGDPAQAVELAVRLVAEGVDRIELCGSFGAVWHARVARAVDGRAPVGAIYYGFESLTPIAAYKARFEAGEVLSDAFLVVHEGADPVADRVVHAKPGGGRVTLVAVPDEETAARVAAELGPALQLIEFYGVGGPDAAERVIEAVSPAGVPVGVMAFAGP
ncbi:DUF6506 family protein [Streptomyces uncialis]|uniref:DUF6506 family protein n=1 Tax=Streptomyces uncialis TaxID=1048205 RepID=UPI000939ED26|nr:DUF6506 family protein [Streptomyces uncialis]